MSFSRSACRIATFNSASFFLGMTSENSRTNICCTTSGSIIGQTVLLLTFGSQAKILLDLLGKAGRLVTRKRITLLG